MSNRQQILKWLKAHSLWLRWVLALSIMGFLVFQHQAGLKNLSEQQIHWKFFAAAVVCCVLSLLLTFFRWWLLVSALNFPFRIRDAFRLGFIGFFCNYIGPGGAGGDLVKGVLIAREQTERRTVAVATVLLDRILGLLALFMVGALSATIQTNILKQTEFQVVVSIFKWASLAGICGLTLMMIPHITRFRLVMWLTRLPLIGRIIQELLNGILLYQSKPLVLVASVLISLLGHLGILTSFYFCGRAINEAAAMPVYWAHIQFIPAAELVGVLIPMPGGVGVLEEAVAHYYKLAGSTSDAGFLTGLSFRMVSIMIAVVGAGYYWFSKKEMESVLHKKSAQAEVK